MREIVSGVRRVNISWSCDSREPVSQYQLMYRDNKVRYYQREAGLFLQVQVQIRAQNKSNI